MSVWTHLVGRDGLVVALEGADSLGVAQGPPAVALVAVGLGQHLQLVRDVLVEVVALGLRRAGADPLAGHRRVLVGDLGRGGGRGLLFGGAAGQQGLQQLLGHAVFIVDLCALAFGCLSRKNN